MMLTVMPTPWLTVVFAAVRRSVVVAESSQITLLHQEGVRAPG